MMTPKDKAIELCKRFSCIGMDFQQGNLQSFDREISKAVALIAVNEFIGDFKKFPFTENSWEDFNSKLDNIHQHKDTPVGISKYSNEYRKFWQDVKKEIENL